MRVNNYSSLDYINLLGNSNNSSSSLLFQTLIDNLSNNTQNTKNTSCCNNNSNLDSLNNMLNVRNVDLNIGKVSIDTTNNTVSMSDLEINYLGKNIKINNLSLNNIENANISDNVNNIISSEKDNETINQTVNTSNISSSVDDNISSKISSAIELAKKQLGKDYVWGANGPDSFDCSGLTRYIYKEVFDINIPRVSYDQAKFGKEVSKDELKPGDLIFFDTMNKGRVSHVGMYIGDDKFIHAANSKKGVITSSLSGHYEEKYITARRPYEK